MYEFYELAEKGLLPLILGGVGCDLLFLPEVRGARRPRAWASWSRGGPCW